MSQFLIYGVHAVSQLLNKEPKRIQKLYVLSQRDDQQTQDLVIKAKKLNIIVKKVSKSELEKLVPESAVHQGIVAGCYAIADYTEKDLLPLLQNATKPRLVLILDGVQDPHNLGACLRTANALGVHCVIAPKQNAVGLTPVVRKVACGAAELTPFIPVVNLARTMRSLQEEGFWLVGLQADASSMLCEIDLKGDIAIVLGGESDGLRQLTVTHCDYLARIDMLGEMESMNVSVTNGICLYEVWKQRII